MIRWINDWRMRFPGFRVFVLTFQMTGMGHPNFMIVFCGLGVAIGRPARKRMPHWRRTP